MADVAEKEVKIASPEKVKNGEDKAPAESPVKKSQPEEAEKTEETKVTTPVKTPEKNGNGKEAKQNGHDDKEVEVTESEKKESTEDAVEVAKEPTSDVCSIKRKSTGGDVTDDVAKDVCSPKKAKLDDKPAEATEANGCENKA